MGSTECLRLTFIIIFAQLEQKHLPKSSGFVVGFCDLTTASLEVDLLRSKELLSSDNALFPDLSLKCFSSKPWYSSRSSDLHLEKLRLLLFLRLWLSTFFEDERRISAMFSTSLYVRCLWDFTFVSFSVLWFFLIDSLVAWCVHAVFDIGGLFLFATSLDGLSSNGPSTFEACLLGTILVGCVKISSYN